MTIDGLPLAALQDLLHLIKRGRTVFPPSASQLSSVVLPADAPELARELNELKQTGMSAEHVAWALERIVRAKNEFEATRRALDLVWTGPEEPTATTRDTRVVVRELFGSAHESVLVSSFALYQGKQVFDVLAKRVDEHPSLQVKIALNISRGVGDTRSDSEVVRAFGDEFRTRHWPGTRLPRVLYDPRALSPQSGPRACLHAKCVVIDERRAFVTSANLTEAAQVRNIEAGVLIDDRHFARRLSRQFEGLIESQQLQSVPGLG